MCGLFDLAQAVFCAGVGGLIVIAAQLIVHVAKGG
jgi:hypothetical protein